MRRARRGASCLIISRLSNKTGARWTYEAADSLGKVVGGGEGIAKGSIVERKEI